MSDDALELLNMKIDHIVAKLKHQRQWRLIEDLDVELCAPVRFPESHLVNYGWSYLSLTERNTLGVFGFDWQRSPEGFDYWKEKVRFTIVSNGKNHKKRDAMPVKRIPNKGSLVTIQGVVLEVYDDVTHLSFLVLSDGHRIRVKHNKTYSCPLLDVGDNVEVCGEVYDVKENRYDYGIHFSHRKNDSHYGYINVQGLHYD